MRKTFLLLALLTALFSVKAANTIINGKSVSETFKADSCIGYGCDDQQSDVIDDLRVIPSLTTGTINALFTVTSYAYVTIRVYNTTDGKQILILFQGNMDPGDYNLNYDLPPLVNGSYQLVVETDNDLKTVRFMMQR